MKETCVCVCVEVENVCIYEWLSTPVSVSVRV